MIPFWSHILILFLKILITVHVILDYCTRGVKSGEKTEEKSVVMCSEMLALQGWKNTCSTCSIALSDVTYLTGFLWGN